MRAFLAFVPVLAALGVLPASAASVEIGVGLTIVSSCAHTVCAVNSKANVKHTLAAPIGPLLIPSVSLRPATDGRPALRTETF